MSVGSGTKSTNLKWFQETSNGGGLDSGGGAKEEEEKSTYKASSQIIGL